MNVGQVGLVVLDVENVVRGEMISMGIRASVRHGVRALILLVMVSN